MIVSYVRVINSTNIIPPPWNHKPVLKSFACKYIQLDRCTNKLCRIIKMLM